MQTGALVTRDMSPEKKKVDLDRNYSEETFYTDSSEDMRSKCKSAATLLQKKRQLRPIHGSGNPYRSSTRLTLTSSSKNNVSLVAQKIMSAKLLRVKQLQNELTDAQFQLNELSTENRILRTLQKRQDMALKKYEGTQAELPQLIRSHNEEVRTLKTKLKQVKNQCKELDNNLKMRETELSALQEQHRHLIKLSKNKHLGEREQLQQQLEHMQDLLKEQDKKIQVLTRKLMLESKNYKHQLTSEIARHKRTSKELDIALERIAQLESVLVAKEKYIAVNLARAHSNLPVSAATLGPQSRFPLFQSQTQSAAARIPSQKHYSFEPPEHDQKDHSEGDGNGVEENEVSVQEEQRHKEPILETSETNNFSEQNAHGISCGKEEIIEEEEEEEDDTDDDYHQYLLSESTECPSYTSQMTASKSIENVTKDFKDTFKENETKLKDITNNFGSPQDVNIPCPQALFLPDVEVHDEIKSIKKRNPLRRYSVSGDSELIVNDHVTNNTRRGSLNGAGDSGTASSGKRVIQKSPMIQNSDDPIDFGCNEHAKRNHFCGNNSEMTNVITNSSEISQSDMTAEEHQLHFKAINSTWNEIQNRIRDETIRAQSVIEKYDEEQRNVGKQIGKKAGMSESYDKNHLLAALRAIEGGADPVELNDHKDKEFHLPICKSKKVEYGNVSQAVENIHRGIPTRASSSVPSIEKPAKEGNVFWENDSILPANLVRSEMDMPKPKSDIMREIFGHHK
ncbi:hypothetical protein R5R35_008543 [Gryllus longicercus]|uniref:Lebercilin domain-containing protein n=1 Tax=Gryllus longicercus TaxID=2509291 RepID=A0AAN9VQ12_9ORTH